MRELKQDLKLWTEFYRRDLWAVITHRQYLELSLCAQSRPSGG